MQIDPVISLAKLTLAPSTAGVQTRQWSVGQLLQASVIARVENGDYTLRIGQQEVRAQSPVALQPGDRMALKVIENGQQAVLQRISPEAAQKETMNQALRDYLPRQSAVSPLLANLSHLASRSDAHGQLPAAAVKLVNSIFQQLPQAEHLSSPRVLRQQVENAALFLESRIAARLTQANSPLPLNNFKASLLRLAAQLPQAQTQENTASRQVSTDAPRQMQPTLSSTLFKQPLLPPTTSIQQSSPLLARAEAEPLAKPTLALLNLPEQASRELAKQVESVLSRVVVNQLNAVNSDQTGLQQWLVDIPMRENETGRLLQLHIQKDEQQAHSEQETETQWTFSLSIDLGELGPLHARISLSGTRLIANLWAEQEHTLKLLEEHTEYLDTRLASAGLEDNEIRCFKGKPEHPVADNSQQSLISHHV